jgi:molecular chaperone HtpG
MAKETKAFQAEVQQILDLMIHSLYSHREIFLRELISNSSDAIDKLRFEAKTHPEWKISSEDSLIRLIPKSEAKTLTIWDNGIGMSRAEVEQYIGTIAHSGTKKFMENASKIKENPELIGQFGVGFYSAFMVADRITLHTQKAGESDGTIWESSGNGEYTLDSVPRADGHGTSITLHLKEFAKEEEVKDFTQEWVLKGVVKKYSDFIEYPVKMKIERQEPVRDEEGNSKENEFETVIDDQTLNSRKAL